MFGTKYYRAASATVLSGEHFAARDRLGVVGSLLRGSFRLLHQIHKIKADLEITIFKLTLPKVHHKTEMIFSLQCVR